MNEDYRSNSWGVRLTSNGRYVFAPTYDGNIYVFQLKTGKVVGVLRDHSEVEVRDVVIHPTKPLLFTCADDGMVIAYEQLTYPFDKE
jgi:WD40 repeat protein